MKTVKRMDRTKSMEVNWNPSLEAELGISLAELRTLVNEEIDRTVQQRKARLAELTEWVEQREKEQVTLDTLYNDVNQSIAECEALVKEAYRNKGLVYRESTSNDDGAGGTEVSDVIVIDNDEDDDVIFAGCVVPPKKPATRVKNTAFKEASAALQRTSFHIQKLSRLVNKLPTIPAALRHAL